MVLGGLTAIVLNMLVARAVPALRRGAAGHRRVRDAAPGIEVRAGRRGVKGSRRTDAMECEKGRGGDVSLRALSRSRFIVLEFVQ